MQVSPALPWGHEVEGGVIQLREAVTKEELLAGKIIPAFDINDRKVAGRFVEYPSDNEIYIEIESGLVYRLPNLEFPTNTLRLERTRDFPESGTMFIEVDVNQVIGHQVEIYANRACTQRPVAGQTYQSLFVKFASTFPVNEDMVVDIGIGDFGKFEFYKGTAGSPTKVVLYKDWQDDSIHGSVAGQVIAVTTNQQITMPETFVTGFIPIYG